MRLKKTVLFLCILLSALMGIHSQEAETTDTAEEVPAAENLEEVLFFSDIHRPYVLRLSERIFELINFPLAYFNTSFRFQYETGDTMSKLIFNQGLKNMGWKNFGFNIDTNVMRLQSSAIDPYWMETVDLDLTFIRHIQAGTGIKLKPGSWAMDARLNFFDFSFIEPFNRFPDIPLIRFSPEAAGVFNTMYFSPEGIEGYDLTFNSGFSFLPFLDFAARDVLASPLLSPAIVAPFGIWFIPAARTEDFRLATWELGFNIFTLSAYIAKLYQLIGLGSFNEAVIHQLEETASLFNNDENTKVGWDYFLVAAFLAGESKARFIELFDRDRDDWYVYLHIDFRTSFNPIGKLLFKRTSSNQP